MRNNLKYQGLNIYLLLEIFIVLSSVLILLLCGIIYYQYKIQSNEELRTISELHQNEIKLVSRGVFDHFNDIATDMAFLCNAIEDKNLDYLNKKHLTEMTRLFYNFAKSKHRYNQVRFLDQTGMERVRIKYKHGNAVIVPKSGLENKKHRYYFKEVSNLSPKEIYISPFDLNIKNNQIEEPIVPIIRICKPVFSKSHERTGTLVLNHFGEQFLEDLNFLKLHSYDIVELLNRESYWLKSSSRHQNWGFMYPERKDIKFSKKHPDVWKSIQRNDTGIIINEQGMFTHIKIHPLYEMFHTFLSRDQLVYSKKNLKANYYWVLLMIIDRKNLEEIKTRIASKHMLTAAFGIPAMIIISFIIALLMAHLKSVYTDLAQHAMLDPLTGLYNRRYLFKRLDEEFNRARRTRCSIGFIMLDIDFFKNFNDNYGHLIGDQVLKSTTSTILNFCREMDTIARYGGEEIAIIVPDCTIRSLQDMCERIRYAIENSKLQTVRGPVSITVSIGACCYDLQLIDAIKKNTSIIEFADIALYRAKELGRNRVVMG